MVKIILPYRIKRSFIKAHPEWIFLYSFDVAGKGALGQCVEAHGEPNAFPVPVRWKGCKSSGFFQDSQYREVCEAIDIYIHKIKDFMPIIPFPKIGMGASRMNELAPKCYKYLMDEIKKIAYPNIEIDYASAAS